ncbi:MAG: hypothetical protein IKK24_05490, partial [Clostridia bacterium]|nr:hypothetical protein [Clostridia bacterium]
DRNRHAIVCDVCGWEQNSSERATEMLTYDQNRRKAIAFVKVRDYSSAKPYLEQMRNIRPDDADIYYLHIMGLTDCCENFLLEPSDSQKFSLVESYWNSYCSLRGDQRVFLPYFQRRNQAKKARYDKNFSRLLLSCLICYLPLLFCLALTFSEFYGFIFPMIVLAIIILNVKPLTNLMNLVRENR